MKVYQLIVSNQGSECDRWLYKTLEAAKEDAASFVDDLVYLYDAKPEELNWVEVAKDFAAIKSNYGELDFRIEQVQVYG